ncbi:hypothetical protein [Streptomyces endophyticus]|uniref:Uncharacterized protein n=1 Tax=Streptomyces endophyticus TaxID=714166 RepID=A0ABU6EZ54_9ACTN|nr:hypothetical protein [Streptomyces endophyticus]MEB8336662.1 hypothetical protein [Streptomyces endophyticus]
MLPGSGSVIANGLRFGGGLLAAHGLLTGSGLSVGRVCVVACGLLVGSGLEVGHALRVAEDLLVVPGRGVLLVDRARRVGNRLLADSGLLLHRAQSTRHTFLAGAGLLRGRGLPTRAELLRGSALWAPHTLLVGRDPTAAHALPTGAGLPRGSTLLPGRGVLLVDAELLLSGVLRALRGLLLREWWDHHRLRRGRRQVRGRGDDAVHRDELAEGLVRGGLLGVSVRRVVRLLRVVVAALAVLVRGVRGLARVRADLGELLGVRGRFGLRVLRSDRFCGGRRLLRLGRLPRGGALRRDVQVLRAGGGRARLAGRHRGLLGGAAVGERANRAAVGVGNGRSHVQRTTGLGLGLGVLLALPLAVALVRGLRLRLPPGALRTGHQKDLVVLGRGVGGIEVGVRAGCGNARRLRRTCVLRQPFARNLTGVGHAYPSPIE